MTVGQLLHRLPPDGSRALGSSGVSVATANRLDVATTGLYWYYYLWPFAAVAGRCSVAESAGSIANSTAGTSGLQACLATPSVGWMQAHLGS